MSNVITFDRIQLRQGTAADLATVNEVLMLCEPCAETDTGKFKIGDGVTAWNSLPYQGIWSLAQLRAALDLLGSTAEGDLIYKGASGWDRLAKGSDGQIMTLASGLPSWATGSGGSGAMTHVGTATLGSPAPSLTLSGLDLSADEHYEVFYSLKNSVASPTTCRLYFNSDTTNTNYYAQSLNANSTTINGGRSNDAPFITIDASAGAAGKFWVQADPDGRVRAVSQTLRNAPSAVFLQHYGLTWITVANLTAMTLVSGAGDLTASSYFKVFKVQ